jgi:hypothetical protein
MSVYIGQFSDINDNIYHVTIDAHLISDSEEKSIDFGETPCIIESSDEDLFAPIKSRSCTIEILTKEWMFDLYSPVAKGVSVKVKKGLNTVFFGYLTPNSYDQSYTYIDNLTLEAVDAVSVLKDFKYSCQGSIPAYLSVKDIILTLLRNAGYSGMLYVPNTLTGLNGSSNANTFNNLTIGEGNFFDDDDEKTPWTQYEVLEEIMRFFGWSLCPDGDNVYIVDYRVIGRNNTTPTFLAYEIPTGTQSSNVTRTDNLNITKSTYAPGEPSLSMENAFNKIEISDNLYEIEEIAPDIFEEDTHISINEEQPFSLNQSKWVKTTVKSRWLRPDEVSSQVTGYEYQTICRIKPETNWTHHFYRMSSLGSTPVEVINQDGKNYYDGDIGSLYVNGPINHYMNTHGCLMQHYAYLKKDANLVPTSLDWEDLLTFFVVNDKVNTNGTINPATFRNLELPVLEYNVPEEVMFKPSSGTSWITISGELFYQYNDVKYGDKNKNTLNIVNTTSHYYTTAPVEKSTDIDEMPFDLTTRSWVNDQTYYPGWMGQVYRDYTYILGEFGQGYKMWKMKVQLGDKYWNGTQWTSTDSTFYLSYNNDPAGDDEEYLPKFGWCHLVPNTTFRDKVGEDAYCIPIAAIDPNAPAGGQLKITVYTPTFYPKEVLDFLTACVGGGVDVSTFINCNWTDITPVIYCKDFEIGYVYTDTNEWYSQHKSNESNSKDVLYTNIINDNYVNEFDTLELKINTQQKNRPISRSYITSNNGYVYTIKHSLGDTYKEQEKNLVDQYYEHYSSPKRRFTCNINSKQNPYTKVTLASLGGRYVVNAQSIDLKRSNNTITLIEY